MGERNFRAVIALPVRRPSVVSPVGTHRSLSMVAIAAWVVFNGGGFKAHSLEARICGLFFVQNTAVPNSGFLDAAGLSQLGAKTVLPTVYPLA